MLDRCTCEHAAWEHVEYDGPGTGCRHAECACPAFEGAAWLAWLAPEAAAIAAARGEGAAG